MAIDAASEMAWNCSVAMAKLANSLQKANVSGTASDKTTAMTEFAATLSGMLPEDTQSDPQYQYFSAVNDLNYSLYSATNGTERQTAIDAFYSTLEGISVTSE